MMNIVDQRWTRHKKVIERFWHSRTKTCHQLERLRCIMKFWCYRWFLPDLPNLRKEYHCSGKQASDGQALYGHITKMLLYLRGYDTGIMCHYCKSHFTVNCSEKEIKVNCCITVPSHAAEPEPKPKQNHPSLIITTRRGWHHWIV